MVDVKLPKFKMEVEVRDELKPVSIYCNFVIDVSLKVFLDATVIHLQGLLTMVIRRFVDDSLYIILIAMDFHITNSYCWEWTNSRICFLTV